MNKKIPVLEIFGPTIQGEGMVIGQKTMFVRTSGCDYRCVWCDSAFTWDGSAKDDIRMLTAEQIWSELLELGGNSFKHVTISGGNPALLQSISYLVELLHDNGVKVALETQGSKWKDWMKAIDDLTLSPKPPSSTMKTDFAMLDSIISKLEMNKISLKVVVFNDEDLLYAKKVHQRYPNVPFFVQVGNDDIETTSTADLREHLFVKYEWLIEKVMKDEEMNFVRVLPQLHTYIWGNKRGV
ncbi:MULTISPECIES: 7-carboxy-7-deazaguanine synthase QueE [Sutcliffiella]|uniref:7-carboxy-7-deazaguanine synthase n=1 Tax=Sutcliffiella cohnii TaxID=33932 RepID=A0A223KPP2_9BACI|nr:MULTISPECIES: 7-carboxy-7-deazaguanine synthase QueE [Sutcliffiella]AST91452.1 7-carboxy-7-deazaguanine synthase QueE [Sutcliffiella cohnii]WBL17279.1 7-carboxy-7-deazaguanine synthase QueE [Sutcliffiella sp. NC1]